MYKDLQQKRDTFFALLQSTELHQKKINDLHTAGLDKVCLIFSGTRNSENGMYRSNVINRLITITPAHGMKAIKTFLHEYYKEISFDIADIKKEISIIDQQINEANGVTNG